MEQHCFAGASRIAMQKYTIPQKMTLEYYLGDHLGSTSLTTRPSLPLRLPCRLCRSP